MELPFKQARVPLLILVLVVLITGCNGRSARKVPGSSKLFTVTGKVQAVQVTSYMYGSHQLLTRDGYYAISSAEGSGVNLQKHEGERITARVSRVDGYPVDGGPPYLFVHEVINN